MKSIFVFNFNDPASIIMHAIISFHHELVWYVILILILVYWCLYKILEDSNWSSFNRQVGFFKAFFYNNLFIFGLLYYFLLIWFFILHVFLFFYDKLLNLISKHFIDSVYSNSSNIYGLKLFFYQLGSNFFSGYIFHYEFAINFKEHMYDNYISYFLYSKLSNSIFMDDSADNFLSVNKFNHSLSLEFIFASFPIIIIALIIFPSMYVLYLLDSSTEPLITVKCIGHQWFWSYEINHGELIEVSFDSVMVQEDALQLGQKRLLTVDKSLVLPSGVVLRFLVTSADVLHSFALPEAGIKVDAVPGRLNQFITAFIRPGFFTGQCSEICGVAHGFMPISVQVLPAEAFADHMVKTLGLFYDESTDTWIKS